MCGRTRMPDRYQVMREFGVKALGRRAPTSHQDSYEPGDTIPTIVKPEHMRILTGMQWGFSMGSDTIYNARAETVMSKPMWRDAYAQRRTIFPLLSFFERKWFTSPQPMAALGIFRRGPYDGQKFIWEASLITTPSSEPVSKHHPRMPFIISVHDIDSWLDCSKDIEQFEPIKELEYS